MEIMVSSDPLLQRIMSATLVSPEKFNGVNLKGAEALMSFLLRSETQAKVAQFRVKGYEHQIWWPAGRNN